MTCEYLCSWPSSGQHFSHTARYEKRLNKKMIEKLRQTCDERNKDFQAVLDQLNALGCNLFLASLSLYGGHDAVQNFKESNHPLVEFLGVNFTDDINTPQSSPGPSADAQMASNSEMLFEQEAPVVQPPSDVLDDLSSGCWESMLENTSPWHF